MKTNLVLAGRLREVFLDGRWIANTNYKEQITGLSWQQSTARIHNLNTIAALTFHVNYYLAGLLVAFETGHLEISDKYSYDHPTIRSGLDWDNLVHDFLRNAGAFAEKVENMAESRLDEVFIEEKYGSFSRNIEAVLEHSYYHLGQIVLIKKMLFESSSSSLA